MPDTTVPVLRTRKPTGKQPWPMVLLAGAEKSGKSYSLAQFSGSDLIDRTFYVEIGEGHADLYGLVPGARYEVVEHDGTYRSIRDQIYAATMQPRPNGKPHCIMVDSMTILWDLFSRQAQAEANARASKNGTIVTEAQITMDLWNRAKDRWNTILDLLRRYDGPVILTARLEMVTVVDGDGKPTTNKDWKVKAEKNLAYDVDAIVRMPAPGHAELTGVRTLALFLPPGGALDLPQFTVDDLLRRLGLAEPDATAPRTYIAPTVDRADTDQAHPERHTTGPRPSSPEQRQLLARLYKQKLGFDRGQKLAAISEALGREVTSTTEITFSETAAAIGWLKSQEDLPPTAPATASELPIDPDPAVVAALGAAITSAGSQHALNQLVMRINTARRSGEIDEQTNAELVAMLGERQRAIKAAAAAREPVGAAA